MTKFEPIIGLEVHAQLKTKSKMFCGCRASFGERPNTNICPVCTGQPGTLPTVNRGAVEMAVKIGLALGSTINKRSVFARKNYFYPDLPKGYQISQYEFPICTGGGVEIHTGGKAKTVSIVRAHLEEDAGKLLHDTRHEISSLADFNRCGVPLVEIVSGPDMRSPKEAGDYLRTLRNILVCLGVCDGNLEEGNFRCDVNISLRPVGTEKFGTRTEMKNLNSFRAVERSLAFETDRQAKVLEGGGEVVQETRLWNDALGETRPMRGKEEAHDYRYFPDPDLLPLIVSDEWVADVKRGMPELPGARSRRFVERFAVTEYDAAVLTDDMKLADYFEAVVEAGANAKKAANWILSELLRELKAGEEDVSKCLAGPPALAELLKFIDSGTISGKMAKDIFIEMLASGKGAGEIITEKGLKQESDAGAIEAVADEVIKANPKQVEQFRSGKTAVLAYFVGQVMKATKGKANPQVVNDVLAKKLRG